VSGGKEQKKTNRMLDDNYNQQNTFANNFDTGMSGRAGTSAGRNDQSYGDIYSGYKGLADGTWGGGGGSGYAMTNFDSGKYGDVQNQYREFMGKNGGMDADRIGRMDQDLAGFRGIGKLGASDAASAARLRGGGVYDEFAKTGGVSDAESYGIRDRAAAGGRSMYSAARDELSTQARAQGGGGANTAAAMARMARQGAQAQNQSALNAETNIEGMKREGRQWGAQGMTSSEQGIVNNQMAGMGAAFSGEKGLANDIRSGRQWGTEGLHGIADAESADRRAAASAGASAANHADAMRMAGLGGLMDLRDQETGQERYFDSARLGNQGQRQSGNSQLIQDRVANNPRKTFGDYLSQGLGAAGGIMTGLGGMGVGRRART
jgi:hypothetical protein